jgi:hypothetical protein
MSEILEFVLDCNPSITPCELVNVKSTIIELLLKTMYKKITPFVSLPGTYHKHWSLNATNQEEGKRVAINGEDGFNFTVEEIFDVSNEYIFVSNYKNYFTLTKNDAKILLNYINSNDGIVLY